MPGRWPCACSRSSGPRRRRACGRGDAGRSRRPPSAGATDLARRLERVPGRAPARAGRRSRRSPCPIGRIDGRRRSARAAGRGARRRGRHDAARALRPGRGPRDVDLPVDRERLARCPASRPPDAPLRLPRHRDDRSRHGGRDGRVPRRAGLVGGPPLPAGPAAAAGPRRRAGACSTSSPGTSRADAWLVTYNGRGFDWPLLVDALPDGPARRPGPRRPPGPAAARPAGLPPPDDGRPAADGGAELLGVTRHDDVDGWEIPGRYLGFLRGGPAAAARRRRPPQRRGRPVAGPAARPARSRAMRTRTRGGARRPATSPASPGPSPARAGHEEALACLDAALAATRPRRTAPARRPRCRAGQRPGSRPPSHARTTSPVVVAPAPAGLRRPAAAASDRAAAGTRRSRAGVTRRGPTPGSPPSGRACCAASAATRDAGRRGSGSPRAAARSATLAWIEVAKLREHGSATRPGRCDDRVAGPRSARAPAGPGRCPSPRLEVDLRHRLVRLQRRAASGAARRRRSRRARTRGEVRDAGEPERPRPPVSRPRPRTGRRRPDPTIRGRARLGAASRPSSAARNTSPAPVGSTAPSDGIGRRRSAAVEPRRARRVAGCRHDAAALAVGHRPAGAPGSQVRQERRRRRPGASRAR